MAEADQRSHWSEAWAVGYPEGVSPLEALGSILELARRGAAAERVTLLAPPEQALALLGEAEAGRGQAALGRGLTLRWEGDEVQAVLEALDRGPAPITEAVRWLLPTASGALVVEGAQLDGGDEAARLLGLQLLAAQAAAALAFAEQLVAAEVRAAGEAAASEALRRECAALRELSEIDDLTGLYNRRFFSRQLEYEVQRHRRYGHPLSLALVDLDHFKTINDSYGHAVGDEALRLVARVALDTMRVSDVVARVGGDELALLMPETPRVGGVRAAERLSQAIREQALDVEGQAVKVTLSIGVTDIEEAEPTEASVFYEAADAALYRAKAHGRDRVAVGRCTLVPSP